MAAKRDRVIAEDRCLNGQLQVEVRERVAHFLAKRRPGRVRRGRRLRRLIRPLGSRPPEHSAEEAFLLASFHKKRAVLPARDVNGSPARGFRLLWQLPGQVGGDSLRASAAVVHQRANPAGRVSRRADCRAEVHHGLRVIARSMRWGQRFGMGRKRGFGPRQRVLHREEPRHDTLHVAVNHRRRSVKSDGRDRGCRVGPDARQIQKVRVVLREAAPVIARHDAGALQEVARPGVVAQTRPFGHDGGILSRGKPLNGWPKLGEPQIIGPDRGDGRLLQHDLGQPDPIGVGRNARAPVCRADPPREHARVRVIPIQKTARDARVTHCLFPERTFPLAPAGRFITMEAEAVKARH